jgi:hypothetical protein
MFERQRMDNVTAAVSGSGTEDICTITGMPLVSLIPQIYPAGMKQQLKYPISYKHKVCWRMKPGLHLILMNIYRPFGR